MTGAHTLLLAAVLAGPALQWSDTAPSKGEIQIRITSSTLGEDPADPMREYLRKDIRNSPPRDSSMQLSITAGTLDSSARFSVKKVEVVDDSGTVLAELKPQPPRSWSREKAGYVQWDERVPSGETLSVSYVLDLAEWPAILRERRHRAVLKATVVVDGKERILTGSVFTGPSGSVRG